MYRSFISLRYLVGRRTNLIGMVGIFLAVGALILILSIMTGFLEESRRAVRGSLSDILIEPIFDSGWTGKEIPESPEALLAVVGADPHVDGATAQIQWGGIITQSGRRSAQFQQILSSSTHGSLLAVQLVGVDVRTADRLAWPLVRAGMAAFGVRLPPMRVHDQFDATEFLAALTRDGGEPAPENGGSLDATLSSTVDQPLFPFAPPRGYEPAGRPKASVVVGHQLFENLVLYKGDEIQIATAVPDPETGEWVVNNREFVVAGSFRSGENETDLGRIYLEREELADFLGGTRRYTQVLVRVRDYGRNGKAVRDRLREGLGRAGVIQGGELARQEVRTWEEFRGNLLGAIENERVLMGIMLSLVLVVAGFTIFAILSMMVTEKRRDIGVLCALGATPRGILELFLLIAFWDALIGAVLGSVFGTWAALEIDAIERWLSGSFSDFLSWVFRRDVRIEIFNRDVYLFDHIPSIVSPLWVAMIVLGAFACTLLFAAIPAWRAARLDPLAALRYE